MKNILAIVIFLTSSAFADSLLLYPKDVTFKASAAKNALLEKSELDTILKNIGLNPENMDLVLVDSKESLLATHYFFQQVVGGIEIEESGISISVDRNTQKVTKIYSSLDSAVENKKTLHSVPLISRDQAFELAWQAVNTNGKLIIAPTSKLIYTKALELVYLVSVSTTSPYGHWNVSVSAINGKILDKKEAYLPRMKNETSESAMNKKMPSSTSFSQALKSLDPTDDNNTDPSNGGEVAQGTAQIFNPNPVITLARNDLKDNSDPSEFLQAYRTENLKDITLNNKVYYLVGPKVTIVDFESPRVAPSTTTDSNWIFERKNVKFNDVMTYYHIDKSIRYLESIGFTGKKVIFPKSINVDANAVNGQDNSYYNPSTRSLAFGHGGIDDNEDSEVILHELGHAIHHHINAKWSGGDTGAMGEGFGDYWAASYTATTEGGLDNNPNWVFKWDGHNEYWPGRRLDVYTLKYDPKRTYQAHTGLSSGSSDELWSTPIYQAFMELYKNGVSKDDIDKIIIEAHFGLGSGVKMPQMATAIVKTAKALFPTKDYDQVFTKHFKVMNIL